jgi:hypothetical protein
MKKLSFLLAVCLLTVIGGYSDLKKIFNGNNINISISENKKTLEFSAEFPTNRSKEVQQTIDEELNLKGDISLENVEVKDYTTPDKQMKIYVKSESGYCKVVLKKAENSKESYEKLKVLSGKINKVLTKKA